METKVYKGREGFVAETEFPLPGVTTASGEEGNPVLRLTTSKTSGGRLVTTASVVLRKDGGFSFVVFRDFSKSVRVMKVRCTESNVRAEHNAALGGIAAIEAEARAFYAKEAA